MKRERQLMLSEIRQAWVDAQLVEIPLAPPMEWLSDLFRSLYSNGGVLSASFRAEIPEKVEELFWRTHSFSEQDILEGLLQTPVFRQRFPELEHELSPSNRAGFESIHPLSLDGELAIAVRWGGAYTVNDQPMSFAKELGRKFCAELFNDQYENMVVFRSTQAWSSWFFEIAWDYSWIFFDKGTRQIHVMFGTDTD